MREILYFGFVLLGLILNGCAHGGRTIQSESQFLCDKNINNEFWPGTQMRIRGSKQIKNPTNYEMFIPIYDVSKKTPASSEIDSCKLKVSLGPKETVTVTPKDIFSYVGERVIAAGSGTEHAAEFVSESGRKYLLICNGNGHFGRYEKVMSVLKNVIELNVPSEICDNYKAVPASQKQEQSAPAATPVEI